MKTLELKKKIALANTYIKFTATEGGKYKFCYQEPAPVVP